MKPSDKQGSIPEGWRLVRLDDVAEVNPRRPRPNVPADKSVTFLPMAAIAESSQGIIARESRPYFQVSSGYTYFEENDFLFSKITPCLQNGKHALATGLKGGFGFGTTEFHIVRAGSSLAAPFMFRVLTQANIIDRCAKSFTGTAGQQRIQPETLKDLPILLPPLPEQRAIAAVLDSIDDAIKTVEAVIAATEQLSGSLRHQLLTLGVPGWHTEWKEAPGLGTIPTEWEVVRLGEVADVQTGRAVNAKAAYGETLEVPYMSVANVKDGYLDLGTVKTMQVEALEIDRYRLRWGDVLFTEGGDADKLGRGTVWREEIPLCLHQNHIFAVRPDLRFLCAEFLSLYATSDFGKRYFLGAAKQTTNLASMNSTQLRQMPLPLPSISEQDELVALLSEVENVAQQTSNERDSLQSLKNSTANAMLTGRVRVVNRLKELNKF